jgi:hypothetical protein
LIDGRIAELDRLSAAATLEGREPAGDGRLNLLLVALRALRQHKLAGASLPPRGRSIHSVAPTGSVSRARVQ